MRCLLLLGALCGFVEPVGDAGTVEVLKTTLVALPALATSPRPRLRATQEVEGKLRLGDWRFPVLPGDPPRISTEPLGKPKLRLRDGKRFEFRLDSGDEARDVQLLFEKHAGKWWYGNANCRRLAVPGGELFLVDVNLDGEFVVGEDAWSTRAGGPLLPLTPSLRPGADELHIERLERSGEELEVRVVPFDGPAPQRAALEHLNRLRTAEGLPAVRLNQELSTGCTAHAEYLQRNAWDGRTDASDEAPQLGATRAGRSAAKHADSFLLAPRAAVDALWNTPNGRWDLADPNLLEVGLSGLPGSLSVINYRARGTHGESTSGTWRRFLPSPADGAQDQPVTTSGEAQGSAGPPILLRLALGSRDLEAYSVKLYKVSGNSRQKVGCRALPREGAAEGQRGCQPTRVLAPESNYVAVHTMVIDGEPVVVEARFRTRARDE